MTKEIINSKRSISQTFEDDEVWAVNTGRESFSLSGKQAFLLKQATTAGKRGLVWFDGFAISIAHIVNVKRTKLGKLSVSKKNKETLDKIAAKKKLLGV